MKKPSVAATVEEFPKLTKDGLAKMFKHNHDVLQLLKEANAELAKESPDPQLLGAQLQSAIQKVEYRLKLIRIADKYDWGAVQVYEGAGDIGTDAEDNKKIKAAAAEAKRMKKKGDALKKGTKRPYPMAFSNAAGPSMPFRFRGPWAANYRFPGMPHGPRVSQYQGCFSCGSPAHWARNCPQASSRAGPSKQES